MPSQTDASRAALDKHRATGKTLRRAYHQVIAIQDAVFKKLQSGELTEAAYSRFTRAWCDLEERRRILTGKPLPGAYRPEKKQKLPAMRGFAALSMKRAVIEIPQAVTTTTTPEDEIGPVTPQPVVVSNGDLPSAT